MKKVLPGIFVVFSLACFLFPTIASAAEVSEFDTEGIEITPFARREAIVRNTGSQRYYYDPPIRWGNVSVLTWRSIFFTNGVAESGRTTTSIRRGLSFDTYFYTWSYRVW
ncbi:hypothetical protein D920_02715 [Enterococcus faecalis 13-SD-W-01]|nr:hypothetical protein D920_02715 [Enterococcus faecalis 13-SD-W-01]